MKYKSKTDLQQSRNKKPIPTKVSGGQKLSRSELLLQQAKRKGWSPQKRGNLFKKLHLSDRRKKILKRVGLVFLLFLSISVIVGTILTMSYLQRISAELPDPQDPFREKELASEVLDRNGVLLYKVFNEYNRDPVDINQVPQMVRWAFIAPEDREFYDHPGFDVTAILRCGLRYLSSRTVSCGGSTITQQTLKLTNLYKERGLERKIKEVLYAIQVERLNSKEDILQIYLTVSPFGSNIAGVTTASRFYFGKDPKDLTLAQAVILGSIINDPNNLSPTLSNNQEYMKENLYARAEYALSQIDEHKDYINSKTKAITANEEDESKRVTEDLFNSEMVAAAREELKQAKENPTAYYKPPKATDLKAGHFVNYAMQQLQKRKYKGEGEEPFTLGELQTGGYKVYTTLDYNLQQVAEKYVAYAYDKYTRWRGAYNVALMTAKPDTGEILTMVGSRDFNGQREVCNNENKCKFDPKVNVLNTLQSAGSSMKMLGYQIAYSEGKLFPGSILPDIPIEWGNYKPRNVDGVFNGFREEGDYSSARNQLKLSRNLPALQVVDAIGVAKYVETGKKYGYTTLREDAGRSIILGGNDVIPIEHVRAYGVFATGGYYVENEVISKIIDRNGNVVYEHKPKKDLVGDPQGIYVLNASTNNMYGDISWDGRDVSGKTGTTEGQRDLIMMMYSPDFVTMGWVGNSDNTPIASDDSFGGTTVKPWVVQYMKEIGNTPYFSAKTKFARPGGVTTGGGTCNIADHNCTKASGVVSNWMIQDRRPPADIEYTFMKVCRDQMDRLARPIDETTGNALERRVAIYKMPNASLQSWFDKYLENSGRKNVLPTEPCTINRNPNGGNGPWAALTAPTSGQTVSGNINVQGTAYTTNNGITKVEFFLDNVLLGQVTTLPYDVSYPIPGNLDNGTYQFKAVAHDESTTSTTTFNVVVGGAVNSNLKVTSPSGTVNYAPLAPSIPVTINYSGGAALGQVTLRASKNGGTATNIGTCNLVAGSCIINWVAEHETAGTTSNYSLTLSASANNTGSVNSGSYAVAVESQ